MANFVHFSNVNNLFKKKNEQVWQSRNQDKLISPALASNPKIFPLVKPKKLPPLKFLISAAVLFLLLVGGVSAMILSQMQQDVRQQASGCTYWDGGAAIEGSYDNRGGIRQQCEGGLWTVPDDGNVDPSQIIAEQNANKPQRGCIDYYGNNVPDGSHDNRNGLRQECVDGLWTVPADGITDPNDTSSLALVGVLTGLESGKTEYPEARTTYDQYCRGTVHPTDIDRCKSLENQLTSLEATARFSGLNDAVLSNTEKVSSAIGGLDDRSVDFNEARSVYLEYCEGAKAQQTSTSACKSLKTEIDEIEAVRIAAKTATYAALDNIVEINTKQVSSAIGGLENKKISLETANNTYNDLCTGTGAQQTSTNACRGLKDTIDSNIRTNQATNLDNTIAANKATIIQVSRDFEEGRTDINQARSVYTQLCTGAGAQQTSSADCRGLSAIIGDGERSEQAALASSSINHDEIPKGPTLRCTPNVCTSAKRLCDQEGNLTTTPCDQAKLDGYVILDPVEVAEAQDPELGFGGGSDDMFENLADCYQFSQTTSAADSCTLVGGAYVLNPNRNPIATIFDFGRALINDIVQPINEIANPTTVLGLNNREVAIAQSLLSRGDIGYDEAQNTYDLYCTGAVVNPKLCAKLSTELKENEPGPEGWLGVIDLFGSAFGLDLFGGQNVVGNDLVVNPTNWVRPLLDGEKSLEELRNNASVISLNDSLASADSLEEFDQIAKDNTVVIEVDSWEEVVDELWQSNPELLAMWQENYENGGHSFNDPEFIAAYNQERNNMNANYFNGVIVVRESDYLNGVQVNCVACADGITDMSLVGLQYLSYIYPLNQELEDARARGILVPTSANLRIVVVPDRLINGQNIIHQPETGVANIPTAVVGGEEIPWPPNMNWLFFDNDPMKNGMTIQPLSIGDVVYNVPVATGLIHEEVHVLGPSDYYGAFVTDDSHVMISDSQVKPVASYLNGWDNISSANFAGDDVMNDPSANLTNVSAFEIAVSSAQGIASTMQEGNFNRPKEFSYNITVRGGGENLTPSGMLSFGQTVRDVDYDLFGLEAFDASVSNVDARLSTVPLSGNFYDLPPSQMFGIDVEQDGFTFTLPMPNRLDFYQLIANPTGSESDNSLNLSITVDDNLESVLDSAPPNSNINVTILSDEEIRNMESSGGVILATAPLEVNTDLVEDPNVGYQVVWAINL